MRNAHIDISKGLDGEHVVFVCFDLREDEIAAAARAVEATKAERYRTPRISADDVVGMRELTALADELDHALPGTGPGEAGPAAQPGHGTPGAEPGHGTPGAEPGQSFPGAEPGPGIPGGQGAAGQGIAGAEPGQAIAKMVFRPARMSVLRDAVAAFVESRDEAEWVSAEDREPLALLREMLLPLEQLCADAMRAALSPESHAR
jgi:hypothetical protein